jgi:glutamyl-tRNA synthetase/nondiscriminating glutamyl-tRNA synthetase
VGNVRTALYNWLFARQHHGVFILRVEDTDVGRSDRRFEQDLMNDLKWLNLTWDEGVDAPGDHGPYRQMDRLALYRNFAQRLLDEKKAYHCFCSSDELEETRQEKLAAGLPYHYSGKCRELPPEAARKRLQEGEPAALRMKVRPGTVGFEDIVFGSLQADCREIGDFVFLRSDQTAPYNFACVIDDAAMKITHVIRGEGHISNTYRQLLIYEALGFDPPRFAHLSTILGTDGSKLSKRHGATSIAEFRKQGYLPEALVNYLALLGWAPAQEGTEILAPERLTSQFDLSKVNRSPATFDWEKLNWVNRSHLKELSLPRLTELALPFFVRCGWVSPDPSQEVKAWLGVVIEALLKYANKIEDLVTEADLIFAFAPEKDLAEAAVQETLSQEGAGEVIRKFHDLVQQHEALNLETYKEIVSAVKAATGHKGQQLFHPIRVALTGRSSGIELNRLIPILEKAALLEFPTKIVPAKERVTIIHDYIRNQPGQ